MKRILYLTLLLPLVISCEITGELAEGSYRSNNLFNFAAALQNYSISPTDGELVELNNFMTSDFIEVKPMTPYSFKGRWVVAWYDGNKNFLSASSSFDKDILVLTSPNDARYLRFSFNLSYFSKTQMMLNEGDELLPFEEFNPQSLEYVSRELWMTNIKLANNGFDAPQNLCLIAAKNIWEEGKNPDYTSFLFLDISTQKLYVSSNTPDNPTFLCDWKPELADGLACQYWMATITKDGDIIFLRHHYRSNPIVYPHTDYNSPYIVDFGEDLPPYGWLMSGGIVQFEDGSFLFGDYTSHSQESEQTNDPRIIWRVSAPYDNPRNWVKAHTFKHVFYESGISEQPNNEIGHIHAIQYDWFTGVTYCTTGDIDRHCRLWRSFDKGNTWSAVDGAVGWQQGDTGTGNSQTNGQMWRFTNMIFTEDYVYWCTDSFRQYHCLYKIKRGIDGVVQPKTLEKIVDLEINIDPSMSQATYVSILMRNPYGILIVDRAEPRTDGILDVKFYDLRRNVLHVVSTLYRATTDAGSLDTDTRIGLPNQFATLYQPESCDYVLLGGGTIIRPNNTGLFNNSRSNYVGALKLKFNM